MPAALTYPGVYVEEIPSGVRTITPVSTSVTAFVGFTSRGPTNRARQIFSTADLEREFGGLSADGDLGHAVHQYFQNGGAEAWIVRVAAGAAAAGITLRSGPAGGAQNVLDVEAASEGSWGNRVRLDVDYDTANPASLFNLTVTEFAEVNGVLTPVRSEVHRNLSMNQFAPNAAAATVNAASELIRIARDSAATTLVSTAQGTSRSGDLTGTDFAQLNDDRRRLAITIDGDGPHEFDIFDAGDSIAGADENARIDDVADRIETRVRLLKPADSAFADFTAERDGKQIVATSGEDGETSSVRFTNASLRNAAVLLKLGLANGGRETDAAALMRPAQTGTVSGASLAGLNLGSLPANASVNVTVQIGSTSVGPETVPLWALAADRPTTLEELRAKVQAALAGESIRELAGARVALVDDRLRIEAGGDPNARLTFADGTTADPLGLSATGNGIVNVADYSLGVGSSTRSRGRTARRRRPANCVAAGRRRQASMRSRRSTSSTCSACRASPIRASLRTRSRTARSAARSASSNCLPGRTRSRRRGNGFRTTEACATRTPPPTSPTSSPPIRCRTFARGRSPPAARSPASTRVRTPSEECGRRRPARRRSSAVRAGSRTH
jgi:hypothetical protein